MYDDNGQPIAFIDFHMNGTSFDHLRELVDAIEDFTQRGLCVEQVSFEFGRNGERDVARVYFYDDRHDDTNSSTQSD